MREDPKKDLSEDTTIRKGGNDAKDKEKSDNPNTTVTSNPGQPGEKGNPPADKR